MMTASEIQAMSDAELNELLRLVNTEYKLRRQAQAARKLAQFLPGDRVMFYDKQKQQVFGTVSKILVKNVQVISDTNVKWKVHPSVLNKVGVSPVAQTAERPEKRLRYDDEEEYYSPTPPESSTSE
jgi:hypothetical protein